MLLAVEMATRCLEAKNGGVLQGVAQFGMGWDNHFAAYFGRALHLCLFL